MKANEMPERVYIFDYNDAMVTPLEGDTTYVREDAFIEKACDYLSYHLDTSKIDVNYKFDFIEKFRKAMKEA